ncbi:MAG: hypothetical protein ACE5O2_02680, partial [Armatimonadota bacterium]
RCFVEPSLGVGAAGVWVQAQEDGSDGWLCVLGGNPGVGGFALKSASGEVLWQDEWAPWIPYGAYVLEGVVADGRVRAQMFEWDGKTLISQSDWVDVPAEATAREGTLGLHTENGIARFWGWEHADTPLSPITDDAPNKRRLTQGEESEWSIVGPGNWMWTDAERRWVRQYAAVERSSAINRSIRGALRSWQCRVKVSPGAGGAGMLFQTDENAESGFLCWLGGTWGAGGLMLYRLPGEALWSSPQDRWHYDTEYVLQATTRQSQARVRMLADDGETVIAESPWLEVGEDASGEGYLGFMTWKGTAEFGDFSEQTAVAAAPAEAAAASALGPDWRTFGGEWQWLDREPRTLRQSGTVQRAVALDTGVEGIMGAWRVRLKASKETRAAGLVFQGDERLSEGFAAVLAQADGGRAFRLENLQGRTLWEDDACGWKPETEYVVEGLVMTDRVAVRLLAGDGETVLSECPAVYVSQSNNDRRGHIGLLARGGPAEFSEWELR